MTDDELTGRLAGLEVVARIAMIGFAHRWWASAYPNHVDDLLAKLSHRINSGDDIAAPSSAAAQEEMIRTLERVLGSLVAQETFLRQSGA